MMPQRLTLRLLNALKEVGKGPSNIRLFILGFAFKGEPETRDLRDSPTLQLVNTLRGQVDRITGFDPVIPKQDLEAVGIEWCSVDKGFSEADAVLFMNNHRDFAALDIYKLTKTMKLPGIFFDGWHLFNAEEIEKIEGARYMGLGYLTPWSQE
jgi:UDP-N-acetyl-D-mannosaminuronic acid dehydrogenase